MATSRHPSYTRQGILNSLHVLILGMSLFLVVTITYDTFHHIQFLSKRSFLDIQFWICMFFLFVFFLEMYLAQNRWEFFITHFLFLLVSIPYLNIIDYYNLSFSPETTYIIRFVPMIRSGYALAIVIGWLTWNRAYSLFITYLTMLIATVYFSSMIFYVLEQNVNPMVTSYSAALWWACMDVTTVGSNIYAVTTFGKIMSVALAGMGMMMFPIFTVYITNVVQNHNQFRRKYYRELDGDMAATESASSSSSSSQQVPKTREEPAQPVQPVQAEQTKPVEPPKPPPKEP